MLYTEEFIFQKLDFVPGHSSMLFFQVWPNIKYSLRLYFGSLRECPRCALYPSGSEQLRMLRLVPVIPETCTFWLHIRSASERAAA